MREMSPFVEDAYDHDQVGRVAIQDDVGAKEMYTGAETELWS
jgi:hypothetical protein